MTRAIYSRTSSSYHAIRVLSETTDKTDDEQTKLAVRDSFYVDDQICGADTEGEPSEFARISRTLWTKPACHSEVGKEQQGCHE